MYRPNKIPGIVQSYTPQGKRKLKCPYCGYSWTSTRMRDPASCPKCYKSWYPHKFPGTGTSGIW